MHGKRHGYGLYCFRNGARYDGMWRKGLKHGNGSFLYPDGTKYVGQWRKDLKHGEGVYYFLSGDTYDGLWFKGFRHGLGTYIYKEVNISHYGKKIAVVWVFNDFVLRPRLHFRCVETWSNGWSWSYNIPGLSLSWKIRKEFAKRTRLLYLQREIYAAWVLREFEGSCV